MKDNKYNRMLKMGKCLQPYKMIELQKSSLMEKTTQTGELERGRKRE